eukprot:TRINITY_DN1711_c0_g1_i1.p1 TRINITY_DN1711_c0_g1~~TRINITY_DN1711_c0_g1_i1.p1  ORF type:complete len:305 (+),score=82.48 TRINITY_DN1711_c0_g1_i1:42-956(+)
MTTSMITPTVRAAANAVAFVAALLLNYLGGRNTGAISDKYESYITPAGYAFSIWGVIYTLLLCFVVWQCFPGPKRNAVVARLSWWFVVSCAANGSWIIAFSYGLHEEAVWVSNALIVVLLVSLAAMQQRFQWFARYLGADRKPKAEYALGHRWAEMVVLDLPFTLYFGWVTLATVLNVTLSLVAAGFTGGDHPDVWGIAMLCVAACIYLAVLVREGNFAYGLPFGWGALAIYSKCSQAYCVTKVVGDNVSQAGCDRVGSAALALGITIFVACAAGMARFVVCDRAPVQSNAKAVDTDDYPPLSA